MVSTRQGVAAGGQQNDGCEWTSDGHKKFSNIFSYVAEGGQPTHTRRWTAQKVDRRWTAHPYRHQPSMSILAIRPVILPLSISKTITATGTSLIALWCSPVKFAATNGKLEWTGPVILLHAAGQGYGIRHCLRDNTIGECGCGARILHPSFGLRPVGIRVPCPGLEQARLAWPGARTPGWHSVTCICPKTCC